jgi:hypothetical protein
MTTPQTTPGRGDGTVPVACTLTSAGLAAQAGRWERLIAGAITECTQTSDGLRMSFRPEPGVEEELRRLVTVENGCCSWAAWTVETVAGALVLDVRSTGPGIATLHGMFDSVTSVRPGPHRSVSGP